MRRIPLAEEEVNEGLLQCTERYGARVTGAAGVIARTLRNRRPGAALEEC